jgi:hypothetical protein
MMMPFDGPGAMMFEPGRERAPVPLRMRRPSSVRTLAPPPPPAPEMFDLDYIDDGDDTPDADIPPVTADEIRELVAAAVRDVAPALKQLAAVGAA